MRRLTGGVRKRATENGNKTAAERAKEREGGLLGTRRPFLRGVSKFRFF